MMLVVGKRKRPPDVRKTTTSGGPCSGGLPSVSLHLSVFVYTEMGANSCIPQEHYLYSIKVINEK
jgi:hypothetical protein